MREFTAKILHWRGNATAVIITEDDLEIVIHFGAHHRRMIDDRFPPNEEVEMPCA